MEKITSKKVLKEWIKYEEKNYGKNKISDFLCITERQILKYHLKLLRKTEYFYNTNKKIMYYIYKIRLSKLQNKYLMHIPINTCEKGLKIMHVGPVLINNRAKIGKDVSIHINTGIVARGTDDTVPVIGNGVVIGIGSVILGNVIIGNNIAIGANSTVNKSFLEENIAIAGSPAKKISNNGREKWKKLKK